MTNIRLAHTSANHALSAPMVATAVEFRQAEALLLMEAKRVRPEPERPSNGTMPEVPTLMWQLPGLLREADSISVGSNDLVRFGAELDPHEIVRGG